MEMTKEGRINTTQLFLDLKDAFNNIRMKDIEAFRDEYR